MDEVLRLPLRGILILWMRVTLYGVDQKIETFVRIT